MAEDIAISVNDVSKMYKLYDNPMDRLKESLGLSRKKKYKEHYALNHVSSVMQNIISPITFFRCFTFLLHWLCLCLCIYILQDFSDFDTCSPITIRVSSLTHFSVCLRLCKKPPAFSVNILHLRACKL